MEKVPYEIEKITNTANQLLSKGSTGSSTGEHIAAVFVINRPDLLPQGYQDMIEAWDRLGGNWQIIVRLIKQEYMHLIVPWH